jgi:hypothetical protein
LVRAMGHGLVGCQSSCPSRTISSGM